MTNEVRSREHILPQWLAKEVVLPEVGLKHYRHSEDENTDELLRRHSLGSFVIRNVCAKCNGGWMSRLEERAKPLLLDLMHMATGLLQLSGADRSMVSAWAIKTAFMIASAQQSTIDLPWQLFQRLGRDAEDIPTECFVLAAQLPFLPRGFLYATPGDVLAHEQSPITTRVGFSIHYLHFVVVLPLREAARVVRTSGVHLPMWPIDLEILVRYQNFPAITDPGGLINFLTGLVEVGIVQRRDR